MKIGICTWYYGYNYGAQAHAYALAQVVAGKGHDCSMINLRPGNLRGVNLRMNLNAGRRNRRPRQITGTLLRCLAFAKTQRIFIESPRITDVSQIDMLQYDLIILGSDAVFNTAHPLYREYLFGVGISTPKITYAPSCESLPPDTRLPRNVCEAVKQLRGLSVRDSITADLIRNNTGLESELVLDPTLLYDFTAMEQPLPETNYLLVYAFSGWDDTAPRVRRFAADRGLRIISVGQYCGWADISYDSASLAQWLWAFKHAAYVFTDSFHGTMFSIKHSREMILVSRTDKQAKIGDFLRLIGIPRGFWNGSADIETYLADSPIDYKQVALALDALRTRSLKYLETHMTVQPDNERQEG